MKHTLLLLLTIVSFFGTLSGVKVIIPFDSVLLQKDVNDLQFFEKLAGRVTLHDVTENNKFQSIRDDIGRFFYGLFGQNEPINYIAENLERRKSALTFELKSKFICKNANKKCKQVKLVWDNKDLYYKIIIIHGNDEVCPTNYTKLKGPIDYNGTTYTLCCQNEDEIHFDLLIVGLPAYKDFEKKKKEEGTKFSLAEIQKVNTEIDQIFSSKNSEIKYDVPNVQFSLVESNEFVSRYNSKGNKNDDLISDCLAWKKKPGKAYEFYPIMLTTLSCIVPYVLVTTFEIGNEASYKMCCVKDEKKKNFLKIGFE
jgi:hypothetical protein